MVFANPVLCLLWRRRMRDGLRLRRPEQLAFLPFQAPYEAPRCYSLDKPGE